MYPIQSQRQKETFCLRPPNEAEVRSTEPNKCKEVYYAVFEKVGSTQKRKQAWSKARATRPVEDSTLNGVGGLGCLTTVIFGQSPGDGEEAGSTDVSRTFQAHRDGQASGEDKVLLTRECQGNTA